MQGRNKNNKISLADIIRYRDDKMNGRERNAFERELQKDPFADDAAEGFSMITPKTAADDMSELKERLMAATRKKSLHLFYRIAASFAVLVLITSVFVITRHEKQTVSLSQNLSLPSEAPALAAGPEQPETQPVKPAAGGRPSLSPAIAGRAEEKDKKSTDDEIVREIRVPERKEAENVNPELLVTSDNDINRTLSTPKASGIALSEGKSEKAKMEPGLSYESPQPVPGRDSFNLYLEKNIRYPIQEKSGQQVVILSFLVKKDSTISRIRIISSPGDEYSREAIRLIEEGPVWRPAMRNSIITEDSVSVNVVFR